VYAPPSGRRKCERELDYRLARALWVLAENRIGVRLRYEWRDDAGTGTAATATRRGPAVTRASVREGVLERGEHSPSGLVTTTVVVTDESLEKSSGLIMGEAGHAR
jgi:hypothetical protein